MVAAGAYAPTAAATCSIVGFSQMLWPEPGTGTMAVTSTNPILKSATWIVPNVNQTKRSLAPSTLATGGAKIALDPETERTVMRVCSV